MNTKMTLLLLTGLGAAIVAAIFETIFGRSDDKQGED